MKNNLVEVTRSFAFKLNVGNYESRDFFCSQKAECPVDDVEKVSEALYQFCKAAVIKSVNEYKLENLPKVQRETPTSPKYWWGNEEPPKWAMKSDKATKMWLFKNGYISGFNDPEVTQEFHSSEEIAAERETQNQQYQ